MGYVSKENKIFIAGHKGMVGSAIVRNLKSSGYLNLLTAERQDLDLRLSYFWMILQLFQKY